MTNIWKVIQDKYHHICIITCSIIIDRYKYIITNTKYSITDTLFNLYIYIYIYISLYNILCDIVIIHLFTSLIRLW
jgi:hypothetical protein